jgi:UDP-N-acetylmuramyl tripeptide synthase
MVDEGCQYAVMEVSSHSIFMKRVRAVKFAMKILTNITHDHLDFHKTFEEYKKVKMDWMNEGDCLRIWPEDWQKEKIPEKFPLPGKFNYENAQTARAAGRALGIKETVIDGALAAAQPAPGRFEKIDSGQNFLLIVDYAHTPDGLEKLLKTTQEIARGKIITVFGCGGDRDRTKRPKMGYISGLMSDYTIITSDNPRGEEPLEIISEIENGLVSGLKAASVDHYSSVTPSLKIKPKTDFLKEGGLGYEIEPDRAKAIERALSLAQAGDVVILAGKGHEDYQIFKDKTIHFDDREVARKLLEK